MTENRLSEGLPDIHMLAYNNTAYTLRALRMLRRWSPGHVYWVWDNGSSPENRKKVHEALMKAYDDHGAQYVFMPLDPDPAWHRNRKIGRAKNAQIECEWTTDWILQIENDCHPRPGWWAKMQKLIAAYPDVGLWGMVRPPNHRILSVRNDGGPPIRIPSMVSGAGMMFNCRVAMDLGIRWPEEPVDYSEHPYRGDMGDFDGIDVEFGERWKRAGYEFALPPTDPVIHEGQPGRFTEYK